MYYLFSFSENSLAKCFHKGISYKENDRFYTFRGSDCMKCVCKPGFNGETDKLVVVKGKTLKFGLQSAQGNKLLIQNSLQSAKRLRLSSVKKLGYKRPFPFELFSTEPLKQIPLILCQNNKTFIIIW